MLFFTDHVLNPTLHGVVSPAQLYLPIISEETREDDLVKVQVG